MSLLVKFINRCNFHACQHSLRLYFGNNILKMVIVMCGTLSLKKDL